jgi:hypothetical protein
MKNDQNKPQGPTMSVPDAGKYYFGLGKNGVLRRRKARTALASIIATETDR